MEVRFGNQINREDFHFVLYDANKTENTLSCDADCIIHGALNAHPDMIIKEPVETIMSNFTGMKCLLDYVKKQKTTHIIYISSSEVYGN